MTTRCSDNTPIGRLRRHGIRGSSGAWNAYVAATRGGGKLIVALGRTAGNATTRSRIRRIARGAFAEVFGAAAGADLLLLARTDVHGHSRRQVRAELRDLMARLSKMLTRHRLAGCVATHG
jgi:ribonuclease P protein component